MDLLAVIVCPVCRVHLSFNAERLECASCKAVYEIADGIPVLVPAALSSSHKNQQARFFDEADHEYEISRPHGTPALYRWFIEEKFERAVSGLRARLKGSTVLTVCGGSGMDAELLARSGGRVVSTDLSPGAARRVLERAKRFDVAIRPVVADAERLPFADRSFDIVFVHDGLHHLENPLDGLREMLRVARIGISVNEPAEAAVTRLAIRLRAAHEEEEAGNPIRRLRQQVLVSEIERAGFSILRAERYGMYYRHKAGRVFRAISANPALPLAQASVRVFNATAGRWGNKLAVQAVRRDIR